MGMQIVVEKREAGEKKEDRRFLEKEQISCSGSVEERSHQVAGNISDGRRGRNMPRGKRHLIEKGWGGYKASYYQASRK